MTIVLIRTVILFLALLIFMRLLGKRELGQLEISELVVSVVIADIAAHPLQDIGIPLLNGLLPVVTLFCMELIISGLVLKSARLRTVIFGKPCILIENGRVCEREMRRNRFTLDELVSELRTQSVTDISRVKYAILETNGKLNVVLFPAERPLTPSLMGLAPEDAGLPVAVVSDGRVLEANLRRQGRDRRWLDKELKKRELDGPESVYYMTVDDLGRVYCMPMGGHR